MPYGSGPILRHALLRATPWQRSIIGAAMVAGGVVFLLLGHIAGVLLVSAGALLLWRMVRVRLGGSQGAPGQARKGRRP
jgi:hypothetical protein